MRKLIYRRENISIALDDGTDVQGSNFWVWYGYEQGLLKNGNMIIDANIIKKSMINDMNKYDHTCIAIRKEIDILDTMKYIGNRVFNVAKKNDLFSELIIEDIYGDCAVVDSKGIRIEKKYLYNRLENNVFFYCDNQSRIGLYGNHYDTMIVTSTDNMTAAQLSGLLLNPHNNLYISYIDQASAVVCTFYNNANVPAYYTIQCVELIAHRLVNTFETEKCNNLHGHSYQCRVTIKNPSLERPLYKYELSSLDDKIRRRLKAAFAPNGCRETTIECIIDFLIEGLATDYEIVFAELFETPNIKTRVYF